MIFSRRKLFDLEITLVRLPSIQKNISYCRWFKMTNEELNSSEILERAIARVELIIASGSLEGEVKR